MPEGDTVWLAARNLDAALAGQTLTRTDLRVPQLATTDLTGRRVLEVVPRGKHLLTRIEGGLTLHTHFRMDGSWHLYRPGERWRGGPVSDVRVVLETPGPGRRRLPAARRRAGRHRPGGQRGGPSRARPARRRLGRGPAGGGRTPARCSTRPGGTAGAARPDGGRLGSATSTPTSSASCAGCRPGYPSARCPGAASCRSSRWADGCCWPTAMRRRRSPPATRAAAGSTGSSSARGSPADAAGRRSGRPSRAKHLAGG